MAKGEAGEVRDRSLEGHFACSHGLLTSIECLGHGYSSRTASHEVSISLPTLRENWQDGFLDPPTWHFSNFRDPDQNAELSDSEFDWGITVGFHNEPDGSQSPDFARIRRWRFETTIATTSYATDYFAARTHFIRELEDWWATISSWISVFTRQDFVEIGKTRSDIRVGPILTWSGDADRHRVNGSIERNMAVVNDQVDILDHRTLSACMALTGKGVQPPDEWLFIRDARSQITARQYRRAVIDAGTAAELAMTALIDRTLTNINFLEREKLFETHRTLLKLSNLMAERGAGTRPDRLQQDLAEPRNKAAHEGAMLDESQAIAAVAVAVALVAQLHPLSQYF